MNIKEFQEIAHLEGLDFIKALLSLEKRRFEHAQFLRGSTLEDINAVRNGGFGHKQSLRMGAWPRYGIAA